MNGTVLEIRTFLPFSQLIICLALFIVFDAPGVLAQSNPANPQTQDSPSPDAVRIDQLFGEIRNLMSKGAYEELTTKALEAHSLSKNIGDKLRQARSLNYIGTGKFHSGRIEEAVEPFKQAAAIAGEAGDIRLQFLALNSGGVLLESSGRYEEALYFYNQALAICRTQQNRSCEPGLLRNVGSVHRRTGNYETALRVLQRSLELSREHKLDAMEYGALILLGSVALERRDARAARNWEEMALKMEPSNTSIAARYELRNQIGIAHHQLGEFEQAEKAWLEALEMARSQKVALAEATVLGNLAMLKLQHGKLPEALELSGRAIELWRSVGGDPLHGTSLLYSYAKVQRKLGKKTEALASLSESLALIEKSRHLALPTEMAKTAQFSSRSIVYLEMIDLLADAGRTDEALTVSETYHGRAFLDSLVEARADLRSVLPTDLLNREEKLLNRISLIQKELWRHGTSSERELQLKKDLAHAEDDLEAFQVEIRRLNPKYASVKYLQPFNRERIQRELLDADTSLIEYALGEEKSFAWAVSRDSVSFAILPGKRELTRLVTEYRDSLLERPNATSQIQLSKIQRQSKHLYKILISPFETQLQPRSKLIVVPDNALAYLPFETLMTSGGSRSKSTHLVERFALAYTPSAAALAAILATQSKPRSANFAGFGDPIYSEVDSAATPVTESRAYYRERGLDLRALPYTRRELTNIGDFFSAGERRIFLGAEANETRVKFEKLDEYRYLHFAAHSVVDEENSSRSGVVLSLTADEKEDGVLQVTEIMRLKLNADLVTLSACRTGMGKLVQGEGVLGLTRAFHYAGANSVVVSLWNVNDIATAELMKNFYRNLKRGLAKDHALRQAKLDLVKGKHREWRHPYYWAPFVLVGANN